MLKKLLLFAILSPLALQPEMKANFLTKVGSYGLYGIKNIVMPWTTEAAETKGFRGATFNDWVDLVTLGITFGNVAYTTACGEFFKNTRAQGVHDFITDRESFWKLPYLLVIHELYKSITMLPREKNPIKLGFTALKIFSNLALKGAPYRFGTKVKK